jgi:DNA (cytosine-5)-methyltransferase 1
MGYHRAGFEVVGVDIAPQPHFPFEFHQADALEYIREHGQEFDVIHASPPCQAHSSLNALWGREYHDHIATTREALEETGKAYVIENVVGAPLNNPLMLCGTMFGLYVIRHRLFEVKPPLYFAPATCNHDLPVVRCGLRPRRWEQFASVVGHHSDVEYSGMAMGIDWMTQAELSQAIPPAYTEWLGRRIVEAAT